MSQRLHARTKNAIPFNDSLMTRTVTLSFHGIGFACARYSERYADKSEPLFPAALMLDKPSAVIVTGNKVTWHFPTSLDDLMRVKAEFPEAKIVAGNTEVGYCGMAIGIVASKAALYLEKLGAQEAHWAWTRSREGSASFSPFHVTGSYRN